MQYKELCLNKSKDNLYLLPYKQLGKDISKYPFVEIRWVGHRLVTMVGVRLFIIQTLG